ncbi:MAG: hypothetical protein M1813_002292 [Trichoglossum hirsutum]|nr:MAG: hypothetical protein M1813_002292 [Trichoglossum hirsutum]
MPGEPRARGTVSIPHKDMSKEEDKKARILADEQEREWAREEMKKRSAEKSNSFGKLKKRPHITEEETEKAVERPDAQAEQASQDAEAAKAM